jgi:hypothetical protein
MNAKEFNALKRKFAGSGITHEELIVELNKQFEGREIEYRLQEAHTFRLNSQRAKANKRPKAGKITRYFVDPSTL